MCGICGEFRFDGVPVDPVALEAMRDRIAHRGPDHADRYIAPGREAGLGFRRLQIIDLSAPANQPMPNEDGSVRVVFNGEIYNYLELRAGLVARGHTVPLPLRHRGHRPLVRRARRRLHRGTRRHVRGGDLGRAAGPPGPRARSLRQEAAVLSPRSPAHPVRLGDQGLLRPPGLHGRDRSRRRGPLLPLRVRAGPEHLVPRRAAGRAGEPRHDRSRRGAHVAALLVADVSAGRRRRGRGAGPCHGHRPRAGPGHGGGEAPPHERRAARRVPERRHRLHRGRRGDAATGRRAAQDLQHRLRRRRGLRRDAVRAAHRASGSAPTTPSSACGRRRSTCWTR